VKEKIAVITGATKGIGYAIAGTLLRAGAKVFICARDKSELKQALEGLSVHGPVEGEVCDVRNEDQVRMMLDECTRVFSGLDILVNNAGIGIMGKTVEELAPEAWPQLEASYRRVIDGLVIVRLFIVYHDFRIGNGTYVQASIAHEWGWSEQSLFLIPAVSLGYNRPTA